MNRKEQFRKWLWYFSFPAAAILLYKLYDNFGGALGQIGGLIRILHGRCRENENLTQQSNHAQGCYKTSHVLHLTFLKIFA